MTISRIGFHPRIQSQLIKAGVSAQQLGNVSKYSTVFGRFHLITPYALQALDRDPALLQRLNDHFASNRGLNPELVNDLESKMLLVTVFGDPKNPIFYGLRGTSRLDEIIFDEMGRDFMENPTLQDIGLCLSVLDGIRLASSIELSPTQLATLNKILDPKTKAIELFKARGVQRVFVTSQNIPGIIIEQEEERTIYIPAHVLAWDIKDVLPLVIGALA